MATVKKGTLANSPEWWVHLRPFNKRKVWKKERLLVKKDVKKQVLELDNSSY